MGYILSLLGPFVIASEAVDQTTTKLNRKTKAILAYLAATGKPQSRRLLAEMFCQDTNDPAGTLRWHLSQIRRRLSEDLVTTSRQDACINFAVATVDAYSFRHDLADPTSQSVAILQRNIDQYRDRFLADLELADCPEYELWLLGERARYEMLHENGAAVLTGRLIQTKAYAEAKQLAQKLLKFNPLLEPIHRYVMWLYARDGSLDAAQKQFELCTKFLWEELAVTASPETISLQRAISSQGNLPELDIDLPANAAQLESELSEVQHSSNFVGRQQELQQLVSLSEEARTGKASTVLVTAVAGGGKSRFIEQYATLNLKKGTFRQGRCYESTLRLPYVPWLAILEPLASAMNAEQLEAIPSNWRQQLARLLPRQFPTTNPAPEQQDFLFRAIVALIEAATRIKPQTIHLDDLHWADATSLQLFCFLGAEAIRLRAPLMLIGSYRQEEASENEALQTAIQEVRKQKRSNQIRLNPLAEAEVALLFEQALGAADIFADHNLAHSVLHHETGGNPLFVTEILQELVESGEPAGSLPVPPSLQALTQRRLAQLSADSRQVLETLAILDRPPSFELLQQVSGRTESETINALEAGLQWRFLTQHQGSQYRFTHDLIADAVRQQLSEIRFQRLHKRAASSLIQLQMDKATIAYHWRMAGETEREIIYTLQAGEEAVHQSAYKDALQLFRRVLSYLPIGRYAERFEAQKGIARALQVTSGGEQWHEALQLLLQVAVAAKRPDWQLEAALQQIAYLQQQGSNAEAIKVTQDALSLAVTSRNHLSRARLFLSLSKSYRDLGQYPTAISYAEQAQELFHQFEDQSGLAHVIFTLAQLSQFQGNTNGAIKLFERAIIHYQQLGDPYHEGQTYSNLSNALFAADRGAEGSAYLEAGLQLSQQLGNEMGAASQFNGIAGILLGKGEDEGALVHYQKALEIVERHQHTLARAVCYNNIAAVLNGLQRYDESLDFSKRALELTRTAQLPRWEAFALTTRGLSYQALADLARANELLEKSFAIRKDLGEPQLTLMTSANLALINLELKDIEAAQNYFAISEKLMGEQPENIPRYIISRFHYAAYRLKKWNGNDVEARQHLMLAYDIVQERLADPSSASSELIKKRRDIREIIDAVAKLAN